MLQLYAGVAGCCSEKVPPASAVLGDEVQMQAWQVEAGEEIRGVETHDRALDVCKLEKGLHFGDFCQRHVIHHFRHGTGANVIEMPIDADRIHQVVGWYEVQQIALKSGFADVFELVLGVTFEMRRQRKRCANVVSNDLRITFGP